MTTKNNKKTKQQSDKNSKLIKFGTASTSANPTAAELSNWQGEIDNILNNDYSSVEQAIEALIETVLDKMSVPAQEKAATREFLFEIFTDDQDLCERIASSLKIK